jgi:hypothetical protein
VKPTFDQIFKLTGTHLAAGALGFAVSVVVFAPPPRATRVNPLASEVNELGRQAKAAASASTGPALERAMAACEKLKWPACDASTVRRMGGAP